MRRPRNLALLVLLVLLVPLVLLAACGPSSSVGAESTPTATAAPTRTPLTGTFYFTTEDGITLDGQFYGQGPTVLIFSNEQPVSQSDWQPFAQAFAQQGYRTMTYDYRGVGASQGPDITDQRDRDLRAAIQAARAHGAEKIVLIGASLGGTLTVLLAAETQPAAIIVLSAPVTWDGVTVTDAQLQTLTMPKLFMVSDTDPPFTNAVHHMNSVTPQPKQLVVYPGNQHGTSLLYNTKTHDDAMRHMTSFLRQYVA